MLAAGTCEAGGTEAGAMHALAVAAARRVLALGLRHVALATLPAGVTHAPAAAVLAVAVTQRLTHACSAHSVHTAALYVTVIDTRNTLQWLHTTDLSRDLSRDKP